MSSKLTLDACKEPQICPHCKLAFKSPLLCNEEGSRSQMPMRLFCCERSVCQTCLSTMVRIIKKDDAKLKEIQINQERDDLIEFKLRCHFCLKVVTGQVNVSARTVIFEGLFKRITPAQEKDKFSPRCAVSRAHLPDFDVLRQLHLNTFKEVGH